MTVWAAVLLVITGMVIATVMYLAGYRDGRNTERQRAPRGNPAPGEDK